MVQEPVMFSIDVVRSNTVHAWLNTPSNYYVGDPFIFNSIIGDGLLFIPFAFENGKCVFTRSRSYFNCDYEYLDLHQAYLLYLSRHPKYLQKVIQKLFELWESNIKTLGCTCISHNCHALVLNELFILCCRIEEEVLVHLHHRFGIDKVDMHPTNVVGKEPLNSYNLFEQCEDRIWKFSDGSEIKNTITEIVRQYMKERVLTRLRHILPQHARSQVQQEKKQGHRCLAARFDREPRRFFEDFRLDLFFL